MSENQHQIEGKWKPRLSSLRFLRFLRSLFILQKSQGSKGSPMAAFFTLNCSSKVSFQKTRPCSFSAALGSYTIYLSHIFPLRACNKCPLNPEPPLGGARRMLASHQIGKGKDSRVGCRRSWYRRKRNIFEVLLLLEIIYVFPTIVILLVIRFDNLEIKKAIEVT